MVVCAIGLSTARSFADDQRAPNRRVLVATNHVQLEYEVPKGCPDVLVFQAQVNKRLGGDPFVSEAQLQLRIRIEKKSKQYISSMIVAVDQEPVGARSLSSASCSALLRATSLAAALVIGAQPVRTPEPDARVDSVPPPTAPEALSPLTTPASPSIQSKPVSHPAIRASHGASTSKFTAEISAKLGGVFGVLPAASESVVFGGRLRRKLWSIEIEGGRYRTVSLPLAGGEMQSGLWLGAASACRHHGSFGICGVASTGIMVSEGRGLGVDLQARTPYAALGARASFEYPLGDRFALRSTFDLSGTLLRARLHVSGTPMGEWVAPPVTTGIGMSISGRLW